MLSQSGDFLSLERKGGSLGDTGTSRVPVPFAWFSSWDVQVIRGSLARSEWAVVCRCSLARSEWAVVCSFGVALASLTGSVALDRTTGITNRNTRSI